MARGNAPEAFDHIKRALDIDPLSLIINEALGLYLYLQGRNSEAIQQEQNTLELDSTFLPAHRVLGLAYLESGNGDRALAAFRRAIELSAGNPAYIAELGRGYAMTGSPENARKLLRELGDLSGRQYVSPYSIARVCASLDDADRTFKLLERACDDRSSELIFVNIEPTFQKIRSDSRFGEILNRIGLAAGQTRSLP